MKKKTNTAVPKASGAAPTAHTAGERIHIPPKFQSKWQQWVDDVAAEVSASFAMITQTDPIRILSAYPADHPLFQDKTLTNPIGWPWETVSTSKRPFQFVRSTENAAVFKDFFNRFQVNVYWGLPLFGPNGDCFGVISIGARKEINAEGHAEKQLQILKDRIEEHLAFSSELQALDEQLDAQREIEKQLRDSEWNLKAILDNSTIVAYLKDLQGRYLYINRHYEMLHNVTQETTLGVTDHDIFLAQIADRLRDNDQKVISFRRPYEFEETILIDNRRCYYLSVKFPIIDASGNICGVGGISTDVTQRKKAEAEARQKQEELQTILDAIPAVVFYKDLECRQIRVNETYAKFYGRPKAEIEGKTTAELYPENAEQHMKSDREVFKTGKAQRKVFERTDTALGTRWFHTDKIPHRGGNGEIIGLIGFAIDITDQKRAEDEKKQLEQQLLQAQKMKAVGVLAGGVAHDFNNLLMGIQGSASLLGFKLDQSESELLTDLRRIEEMVQRGEALTQQLLGFARRGKYQVVPTDLNRLCEKSLELFWRAKKEINIIRDFDSDLLAADVDPGQIEQVLLNLFVNAGQAMPGGGSLYVTTRNRRLSSGNVTPFDAAPGEYVQITVRDTGVGMNKATMARIFEPFFTTKEVGQGSGMGLASAYGIVQNHNGFISVESAPGEGATFRVCLPASEKPAVTKPLPTGSVVKGSGGVLLVDDEKIVLDVGEDMLRTLGYSVYTAPNGTEAIQMYQNHQDEISVVILDMIMPEMGGKEVFCKLKQINPKASILLSSGYSADGVAKDLLRGGAAGFVQKPFSLARLSYELKAI